MSKFIKPKLKWRPKHRLQKLTTLAFILLFAGAGTYLLFNGFAASCTLSAPTSTAERKIQINMSGCTGVQYFNVSESQDFGASNGVHVSINNVAADKSYADVSITYPNGIPATNSTPFSVPATPHQVKVLAVLFTFDDANGQSAGLGNYETTNWLQRLVFGDGVAGFDGGNKTNNIKNYIYQSSNGEINLTGNVYPQVVHLPLEKYRQFLGSAGTVQADFGDGITRAIEAQNPGFLSTNKFDFLLGLSSEQYSVSRDLYPSGTSSVLAGDPNTSLPYITYSIPTDTAKSIFGNTIQETRTSTDANTVITLYNPPSTLNPVEGVWLASDTNRTGTNYYTGGSITTTADTKYRYLKLGTALPNPNTSVIVRYKADMSTQVSGTLADQVSSYGWYGHFMHELQHQISNTPAYWFGQRGPIGDLYYRPASGASYDLMSNGTLSGLNPINNQYMDSPSLLGAYHREILGYANPYTLNYGQNESSVRVYRIENGDPANNSRNTIIKVPLSPVGDPGMETRLKSGATLSDGPVSQYRGNEYLLLEWRNKTDTLENGVYNFDQMIPSEGLVIYHVIENAPYGITAASTDIARIIDATPDNPAFNDSISDTSASPPLFGPQSGVNSYTAGSYWQEKTTTNDTHTFDFLLSPGAGTKTLYVKFADANGNIVGTQQLTIDLTSNEQPINRLPTLSLSIADGAQISSNTNVIASYTAPNGAKNIRFYIDDISKQEKSDSNIPANSTSFFIRPSDLTSGSHQLKVIFYDNGLNKVTKTANFSIVGGGDNTVPAVSINPPTNNSTIWGSIRVGVSSIDNVTVVKTELYIDSSLVAAYKGSVIDYIWYTAQTTNGSHTLTAKAYDAASNSTTSSPVTVTVNNIVNTTAKPGDINSDGSVNIFDLSVMASHWGQSGQTLSSGDLNNDGAVNIFDLSVLANYWGA